jgi:hypothetical protein
MSATRFGGNRRDGHPPNRICPMCGVTMFASAVNDDGRTYHAYHCPRCGCVITSGERDDARDPRPDPTTKRQAK